MTKYYIKAVWYILCVAAITLTVIGAIAAALYFAPTAVAITAGATCVGAALASLVKDVADDIKWNAFFKEKEER